MNLLFLLLIYLNLIINDFSFLNNLLQFINYLELLILSLGHTYLISVFNLNILARCGLMVNILVDILIVWVHPHHLLILRRITLLLQTCV